MTSEYAQLSDLVLTKGWSRSEIIHQTHQTILEAYKHQFPQAPIDSQVVLDEVTGQVHIFSQGKDVTPPDFAVQAASLACQVLIQKLQASPKQTTSTNPTQVKTDSSDLEVARFFMRVIFWGYNSILMLFFYVNLIRIPMTTPYQDWISNLQQAPPMSWLTYILLLATPAVASYVAYASRADKKTKNLAKIFFVAELPTLVILFILSGLKDRLPIEYLFSFGLLAIPLYAASLKENPAKNAFSWLRHLIAIVCSLNLGYGLLLLSFFIPPIIIGLGSEVWGALFVPNSYQLTQDLVSALIQVTFGTLFLALITALLISPFVVLYVIVRSLLDSHRQLESKLGPQLARQVSFGIAVAYVALAGLISFQPIYGHRLLEQMVTASTSRNFESRYELVKDLAPQKTTLDEIIETSRDKRYSYWFTKNSKPISQLYRPSFGEINLDILDRIFLAVAYPLVYYGPEIEYSQYQAYDQLFTAPTLKTDTRPTIVDLVDRQIEVTTLEAGLLAQVTQTDTFQNSGFNEEEVIYEFSLPYEVVMIDLKLGPNLEFPGQIAPRGAAQETYQQQLARRRDPALLETIGPRQYRLRVYPIPSKTQPENLKVSFTYLSLAHPQGIGLPSYSRQSNLELNTASINYFVDGQRATAQKGWLQADKTNSCLSNPIQFSTDNLNVTINQTSNWDCTSSDSVVTGTTSLSGKRIGVVYDVGLLPSQVDSGPELTELLAPLQDTDVLTKNEVELIYFNDLVSQPVRITPDSVQSISPIFRHGVSDLDSAVATVNNRYNYDLLILVTDYPQNRFWETPSLNLDKAPLTYLVHPNGVLPRFSQNFTTSLLVEANYVATSLDEALAFYQAEQSKQSQQVVMGPITVNFTPTNFPTDNPTWPDMPETVWQPLLSRAFFIHQLQSQASISPSLDFLDRAHTFAKNYQMVTPYSSYIALVNQTQQQQLDRNATQSDRYNEQVQIENPANNRNVGINPTFEMGVSRSIPFFGVNSTNLSLPSAAGGDGSRNTAHTISSGSGILSITRLPAIRLFVLLNLLLLGGGSVGYLVIRWKKQKMDNLTNNGS